MTNKLAKYKTKPIGDYKQLFRDLRTWRNISETTIEALEDFMFWYENDYDFGATESREVDIEIQTMRKLIDTFLLEAGVQKERHNLAELKLLEEWTNSCGVGQ